MALFAGFLLLFVAGIWGTILRPAAYEVRGTVVARPAPDMLVVRHDAIAGFGMGPMELMAVFGEPARLDGVDPRAGDRLRLAVRQDGDRLILVRIEKLPR